MSRRLFVETGVLVDPDKLEHMVHTGRPTHLEDIRSLIQVASFNAKFAFEYQEDNTCKEIMVPLRQLMINDTKFN